MGRRWGAVAVMALLHGVVVLGQGGDWSSSPAVGLGPLVLRSQSPLNILRLTPTPLSPVTVERGTWLVGVMGNWNNYFDVDPRGRYVIDAESAGATFGFAYGLTDRLDLSLALPVSYRGGGSLDRFIENFEGLIGVSNEARKRYPRNRFLILVHGDDGATFERSGAASGWGLEDGSLGARYQITPGSSTTPAVLVGLEAKLPVGRKDALRSTGGVDLDAGVSIGQRLGRFNLYGTASVMKFANDDFVGVRLRSTQWSWFAAIEYRRTSRTSYLLQALVTSPSARDVGDLARNTYEITLGVKHVLRRDLLLEASLLENLLIFDNSPDVGFHLGLVWRFGAARE